VRRVDAAVPVTLDADFFRGPDDLDQHPFDEQAHDGLALGLRRCVGASERRQILRQIADRGQLGCGRSLLARAPDALMLRLERACSVKAFSQSRSSVRATSRFSGSTAAYCRRARSTS